MPGARRSTDWLSGHRNEAAVDRILDAAQELYNRVQANIAKRGE